MSDVSLEAMTDVQFAAHMAELDAAYAQLRVAAEQVFRGVRQEPDVEVLQLMLMAEQTDQREEVG